MREQGKETLGELKVVLWRLCAKQEKRMTCLEHLFWCEVEFLDLNVSSEAKWIVLLASWRYPPGHPLFRPRLTEEQILGASALRLAYPSTSDFCQPALSLTLSGPCRMTLCTIRYVSDHLASQCNADMASRAVNTGKLSCMDYCSLGSQNMSRVVLSADQP